MRDLTEKNHYKSVVTITVEVIHEFPEEYTIHGMISNALSLPDVSQVAINSIDTVPVIVEKEMT